MANLEVMKDSIDTIPETEMMEEANECVKVCKDSVGDPDTRIKCALANCSLNVERDIGTWFDKSWPTNGVSNTGRQDINIYFILRG